MIWGITSPRDKTDGHVVLRRCHYVILADHLKSQAGIPCLRQPTDVVAWNSAPHVDLLLFVDAVVFSS